MVEDAVDEVAIRREAGIVDIVDVISGDRVASLIGAFSRPARFVIASAGQEFVADLPVFRDPHSDIAWFSGVVCHARAHARVNPLRTRCGSMRLCR